MAIVVPFDGSELADAPLVRATEFGNAFDEDVSSDPQAAERPTGTAGVLPRGTPRCR